VSSSVPARTRRTASAEFELGPGLLHIQELHSGQCHLVPTRPLSAVRRTSLGSPAVKRKALSRTTIAIEKALLVTCWQSVQWQV